MLCRLLLHEQRDDIRQNHDERQAHHEKPHRVAERQHKFLITDDFYVVLKSQKLRRATAAAHEGVPQDKNKRYHRKE